MEPLTDTEAAYIAGLLDGEGCFTFMRQSNRQHGTRAACTVPMIVLAMTHEPTVDYFSRRLGYTYSGVGGGKVGPRWKQCFRVAIYGRKAQALCAAMMPYLITKRDHAQVILDFPYPDPKRKGRKRGDPIVDPDTVAARDELVAKMRILNKRGR